MILEAEIAFIGSNATFGFIPNFLSGHGLALGVVGNDRAIEFNDGSGAIESNEEGVPLAQLGVHGVLGFGQTVETARSVMGIAVVINLDLISPVDSNPRIRGAVRDSDVDSRVVLFLGRLEDHTNLAITESLLRII